MAGIDASTEDPQGGVIRRKPGTREPSGVMEGTVLIRKPCSSPNRAGS